MGLMDAVTVTWTRYRASGIDALGHQSIVPVAGFSRTVKGNWQDRAKSARKDPQGLTKQWVAAFYSESFTAGAVGDRVTTDTKEEFVVGEVLPRLSLFSSSTAFTTYRLNTVQQEGTPP